MRVSQISNIQPKFIKKFLELGGSGGEKKMGYKKLESNFWKPEKKGEEIEGTVIGTEKTNFGEAIKFELLRSNKTVLFNYTALNERLKGQIGNRVKIVYKGIKKSKAGQEYKDFDVFLWAEEGGDGEPKEEAVVTNRLVEFTSKKMDITEEGARDMLQNDEVRQKWQEKLKNSDAEAEVGVG